MGRGKGSAVLHGGSLSNRGSTSVFNVCKIKELDKKERESACCVKGTVTYRGDVQLSSNKKEYVKILIQVCYKNLKGVNLTGYIDFLHMVSQYLLIHSKAIIKDI